MKFLKKIGSPKDFEINNLSIVQPICQYFHSINIIKSFQKSFLNLWKIYRISMEWFPSSLPPAHLPEKRKRKKVLDSQSLCNTLYSRFLIVIVVTNAEPRIQVMTVPFIRKFIRQILPIGALFICLLYQEGKTNFLNFPCICYMPSQLFCKL